MDDLPKETKMSEVLKDLKRDLPLLIQYHVMNASITRAKFSALIAEGFNEEQALRLCMEVKF